MKPNSCTKIIIVAITSFLAGATSLAAVERLAINWVT